MATVVLVAVDNAACKFDILYSYRVPYDLVPFAQPGARVLVPFGRAAPRMGVVMQITETGDAEAAALKAVIDIERDVPLLNEEMVQLIRMLRDTTFCTYYDAVKAILPRNSRLVTDTELAMKPAASGHLETVYLYNESAVPPRLSDKQRAVCDSVTGQSRTAAEIMALCGVTRSVIDTLEKKGILSRIQRAKNIEIYEVEGLQRTVPPLTAAQQRAFDTIVRYRDDPQKADTTLLYGVTSSGKTLIYIKLIEAAVAAGKSALMLVPEIALATQMIYRLRELFGVRVGIIHSGLSDTERQLEWDKIRDGSCDIVIGTRSAVFAPLTNLGILIVDEEQEQTYVSEQNPRYSAAAVAAYRARYQNAHLVLSSATPAVETYYRARNGQYNFVALEERYGNMPLPKVRVVDMRRELLAGNSHHISSYLKSEIDARIARGEQSILLLNRRGYRTVSMCRNCKKIVKCGSCDAPLVIHKGRNSYVCHYCGRSYGIKDTCDDCGGGIKHTGIGTQKIEEDLEQLFPAARILRLDLDTVSRKHSLEQLLAAFSRGEYDMMIGTQMIAKGLDFPNVTLVGVLSIDQLLLMPSFRANERTFAMLTQVIGRSGRGDKKGEAIIQTIDPGNEIIRLAAKQDYEVFYESEIRSRKIHLYPPFCAICSVGFIAEKEPDAAGAAAQFAAMMQEIQQGSFPKMPLRLLGPAPMRVSLVNDLYRYRIVLKHRADHEFRAFLRECVSAYHESDGAKKARIYVDFAGEPDN